MLHMMKSLRLLLLVVPFLPSCSPFTFPSFPAPANAKSRHFDKPNPFSKSIVAALTALTIGTSVLAPLPCAAAESRLIGQIAGSGLVFKDTLNVESFDDPKVNVLTYDAYLMLTWLSLWSWFDTTAPTNNPPRPFGIRSRSLTHTHVFLLLLFFCLLQVRGVTLYVSNFQRPLTERLSKDFFNDPSYASVGCAKTGKIEIADNINTSMQGEEVFEESKSLLFKTLRVQRIYDKEKNTVVYVSFNTRLDKNEDSNKSRFKSSICAVNLE
jgi:catabolite regulation protein CreA